MKLTNEEKCTYCREYGNLPCEECDKKLEAKKSMSKTKFTKVAVSERLPKDFSKILINYKGSDDLQMYDYFDNLHEQDFFEENINFWLEESPDREDEMIEMLRKIEDKLNDFHNDLAKSVIDMEVYNPLSSDLLKIKSLLQSLTIPNNP